MHHQPPHTRRTAALALALGAGIASSASAQTVLPCGGLDIDFVGEQVQEFLIPQVARGTILQITVHGADGGNYPLSGQTTAYGGQGAAVSAQFVIGSGANELQPGGKIRFIIGEGGADRTTNDAGSSGGAGGGGGSGAFYVEPNGEFNWTTLVVAGGGGGAARQGRADPINGLDANTAHDGRDGAGEPERGGKGGSGGSGGTGAEAWDGSSNSYQFVSGGGGGITGSGTPAQDGGGGAALSGSGVPLGGAGGSAGSAEREGGWGAGGGGYAFYFPQGLAGNLGAAGGGGGYSGGGGGGARNVGGGGGSYINTEYAISGDIQIVSPGKNGSGFIHIDAQVANDHPAGAIALTDGNPVSSPFLCGATQEPFGFCGDTTTGPDVWYSYTNSTGCTRDITIQVTSGTAVIYGYNGAPFDQDGCRYQSDGGGFYLDTLGPGETIMLRVADIYTDSFTLLASSTYASGQPDCDNDGIPDACDVSDDCPPANDHCADAIPLTRGTYPYDMRFGDLDGSSSCGGNEYYDIWYTFAAPADGQLVLLDQAEPLQGDRTITIFDGCGGNELSCVSQYNQRPLFPNTWTTAFLPMKSGEQVTIRLASNVNVPDFLGGILTVGFDETFTNDRCEDATLLEPQIGQTLTVPFDTTYAENSGNLPDCIGFDYLDAWFVFQAPADGPVTIDTQGTPWYFSGLSLYDACAGNELACDNSANQGGAWASIDYDATLGQTIYVRVSGYSWAGSGAGLLNITIPEPCAGDFNGDGSVNTLDVLAFLNAWSAHDPRGDFNADGAINTLDVLAFLNAWATGC